MMCFVVFAMAQEEPQSAVEAVINAAAAAQKQAAEEAAPPPAEEQAKEVIEEEPVAMVDYPVVKLQSLEKTTARTSTFEANVGSTVKFGSLFIRVQACRKAPPIEQPESAAFLQIWQVVKDTTTQEETPEWVFSGWMFASSPGLSSMDHPFYDVWVLDCLEAKTPQPKAEQKEAEQRGEGELEDDAIPAAPEATDIPAEN